MIWRSLALRSGLAGLVSCVSGSLLAQETVVPEYRFRTEVTGLVEPTGVAVIPSGGWCVVERGRHRVRLFNDQGHPVRVLGRPGTGPGEFQFPQDVAVSPSGDLFVADTGNHRVQRLDSQGNPQGQFGSFGSEPGQFHHPRWIAASDEWVVVVESGSRRIQVLDHDGKPHAQVSALDGPLSSPSGVAIDADGRIHCSDAVLHQLFELNIRGETLNAWGDFGGNPGLMSTPRGLAISGDALFVADSQNHWIQVFHRDGRPWKRLGKAEINPYEGQGRLQIPIDVAVSDDRSLLVLAEPLANRVQVFEPDPDAVPQEELEESEQVGVRNLAEPHYEACVDEGGGVLVAVDVEFHRLLLNGVNQQPVSRDGRAGRPGSRLGEFMGVRDVWVAPDGQTVLVADAGNQRLQLLRLRSIQEATKFAADRGEFLRALELPALQLPDKLRRFPIDPIGIDVDGTGHLFCLDSAHEVVLRFDPEWNLLGYFGGHGSEPGKFQHPTTVAVNDAGTKVYVADSWNRRVQVLDAEGKTLGILEAPRAQPFVEPFGVAVASDGSCYVTDSASHRIHRFTAEGQWRGQWGGRGLKAGQFLSPRGVTVTADGRVIVLDQGNRRCQIFSTDGQFLDVFGVGWYVRAARSREGQDE